MKSTKLFEIKEGLFIAFQAIAANKIRAILTTLGIVIGVTSVVLVSVAISGIDNAFNEGIGIMGVENVYVSKFPWGGSDKPFWEIRNRPNLTYAHYKKYQKQATLPVSVSPFTTTFKEVKYDDKLNEAAVIYGTNHKYLQTSNVELGEGRFFTETEERSGKNVAVMGADVAKNLFGEKNFLGLEIDINGVNYKIVGYLKKQGTIMMGNLNPDKMMIIPIESMFKNFKRKATSNIHINIRAASIEHVEELKDEVQTIMRNIRGLTYREEDNFSINQQEGLQNIVDGIINVIRIAGYSITGLSLLVGAIGIMNIMFVSVKERTKEIGIRKAIGAKRRAILGQFIFESSSICLLGGIIGLLAALLLSMVINQFLPTSIQPEILLLAISISIITGAVSGIAPAYTAAKLDPVDALRYE